MTKNNSNGEIAENNTQGRTALWGGRFSDTQAKIMQAINASIDVDKRLYKQDIQASKAHVSMLMHMAIVSKKDGESILSGLTKIEEEITSGAFVFDVTLEDIHMHVEARLAEIIGDPAKRLHTARSRNDQVATDFKMWIREHIDYLDQILLDFQKTLLTKATDFTDWIMPGFTHLQTAQPITLGHHLMAYYEMIKRDRGRLSDCRKRLNECPLGSAALAGTGFPIDRDMTAKALDFEKPTANSLDAVSDRDFALEFLAALSITSLHLSRLADEIVLWSSPQFNFITLSDHFSSGSSIMPQKRNPDAAELVRAKVGRIAGGFNSLLMVMKGLPLAYSKDMQEDKAYVFQAVDDMELSILAMHGIIETLSPNKNALLDAANNGFSTATDLADWLVRVLNIPFRQAHHITGAAVKMAEKQKCLLKDLSLDMLQSIEPKIDERVYDILSVEKSVTSRISYGGTAPSMVKKAIFTAKKEMENE